MSKEPATLPAGPRVAQSLGSDPGKDGRPARRDLPDDQSMGN